MPIANALAGTLTVALPLTSVVDAEAKLPLDSVTDPVGVGLPLTVIVVVNVCAVVIFDADGVTVTVGVVLAGAVTVTMAEPEPLLYVDELEESGV